MFCTVNDCEIYYEEIGEGIPILMFHGFPLDHQMMKGCMEPIFKNRHGWKRIYIDLPGMGKSTVSEKIKTTDDMTDLILGFIKEVLDGSNFIVVGESFGGIIARSVVYHQPEKIDGLFLLCPSIKPGVKENHLPTRNIIDIDHEFMNSLKDNTIREFIESFAVKQNAYTCKRIIDETYSGYNLRNKQFIDDFVENGKSSLSYDIDDLKEPFTNPSLIITGRQDHWVGYKGAWNFYDNYTRGTFVVLDKAGHGLQYEQVPLFTLLVDEWLDRVEEKLTEES